MSLEDRESIVKENLSKIKNNYDFIVIDCPAVIGNCNNKALVAAGTVACTGSVRVLCT